MWRQRHTVTAGHMSQLKPGPRPRPLSVMTTDNPYSIFESGSDRALGGNSPIAQTREDRRSLQGRHSLDDPAPLRASVWRAACCRAAAALACDLALPQTGPEKGRLPAK